MEILALILITWTIVLEYSVFTLQFVGMVTDRRGRRAAYRASRDPAEPSAEGVRL
jgi:hypothetical protein